MLKTNDRPRTRPAVAGSEEFARLMEELDWAAVTAIDLAG